MDPNWKGNLLTGSEDALFIKNHYQPELDILNDEIVLDGKKLECAFGELSKSFYREQSLMRDVDAHKEKRENAYAALNNILNKEKDFEAFMNKETNKMYREISKNQTAKSMRISQKIADSENEMVFAATMKYLEKYPESQTKHTIREIIEQIKNEEQELNDVKKTHNHSMAEYNSLLAGMTVFFKTSEEKIKRYNELLEEANKRIKGCRFFRWGIYKLASEAKKIAVAIDTRDHRTFQFAEIVKEIRKYLSKYNGPMFVTSTY